MERISVDQEKKQVRLTVNPNIYDYAYVKYTKKIFEELFVVDVKKSKDDIQVLLKPKKTVRPNELANDAYEFFNCLLAAMKHIKTSAARK